MTAPTAARTSTGPRPSCSRPSGCRRWRSCGSAWGSQSRPVRLVYGARRRRPKLWLARWATATPGPSIRRHGKRDPIRQASRPRLTAETGESRRTPGSVPATPVLDATYLATRPSGAKEGVLLCRVGLHGGRGAGAARRQPGPAGAYQDWLEMGRGLSYDDYAHRKSGSRQDRRRHDATSYMCQPPGDSSSLFQQSRDAAP